MQPIEKSVNPKMLVRLFGAGVFVLIIAVLAMTFMLYDMTPKQSLTFTEIWTQFDSILNGG